MNRIVVLFLLFTISIPAFGAKTYITQAPHYNPHYSAYYGGDYIPNHRYIRKNSSMFTDINNLEMYAMNRNFTKDSDLTRIERLETQAFGAVQQGDLSARYDNVREAILSRPKQNYKTSLFRGLKDYFSGQITGYTPQINQNNYNFTPYGKSSNRSFVTPFGSGYETSNYGLRSGCGVHILD